MFFGLAEATGLGLVRVGSGLVPRAETGGLSGFGVGLALVVVVIGLVLPVTLGLLAFYSSNWVLREDISSFSGAVAFWTASSTCFATSSLMRLSSAVFISSGIYPLNSIII